MITTLPNRVRSGHPSLWNLTAADLMTPNPVSIHEYATLFEAANFFSEKQISAAPVINIAGRPVGVISRSDLVRYLGAAAMHLLPSREPQVEDFLPERADGLADRYNDARHIQVGAIMTPTIYAVPQDTPLRAMIDEMLRRDVHRLFVLDADGLLIGVVTTLDVLRAVRNAS
jgi:CBS domain-containing protein